jgi:hypothetical protein
MEVNFSYYWREYVLKASENRALKNIPGPMMRDNRIERIT